MHTLIFGTAFLFNMLFYLSMYALIAFSLFCIARNNNIRHPYLAFIPIVQYAIIGMICEEYVLLGVRIRPLSVAMVGLGVLQLFIGRLLFPLQIVINLLIALILHKFFSLFHPQRALIYAALSTLGFIPLAITLYLVKDKPMCMSAAAYPYPFANRRF